MNWIVLSIAVFFNALANILVKVGVVDKNCQLNISTLREVITKPSIIGGILSFIFALMAYGYVLSKMNLSVAYPLMTSIGFGIITLASYFLFKESISPIQVIGFLFILSGVWMVGK